MGGERLKQRRRLKSSREKSLHSKSTDAGELDCPGDDFYLRAELRNGGGRLVSEAGESGHN